MDTKKDECADGCPRGCAHDRQTKQFPALSWPRNLQEREAFMMSAIVEGEAAIDRLAQMVGTDDFTGLAADAMAAFEVATRDGEPEADEWARVVELAERYQREGK